MTDFVESLGRGFVAHRLRRLSEALVDDCGEWFSTVGISAPPKAASTLLLLRARGPLSVMEIATELRFSNPVVAGLVREMVRLGLAYREPAGRDRRRWPLVLTFEGRKEAERIAAATRMMSEAYAGLFDEAGFDLFAAVEALEAALGGVSLAERLAAIAEGRRPRPGAKVAS